VGTEADRAPAEETFVAISNRRLSVSVLQLLLVSLYPLLLIGHILRLRPVILRGDRESLPHWRWRAPLGPATSRTRTVEGRTRRTRAASSGVRPSRSQRTSAHRCRPGQALQPLRASYQVQDLWLDICGSLPAEMIIALRAVAREA